VYDSAFWVTYEKLLRGGGTRGHCDLGGAGRSSVKPMTQVVSGRRRRSMRSVVEKKVFLFHGTDVSHSH